MSKIIAAIRHEVVLFAGVLTAALTFVTSHEQVLAAIIPLVVSLITRSQVSPLSKLEQLLAELAKLKTQKPPAVIAVRKDLPPIPPA